MNSAKRITLIFLLLLQKSFAIVGGINEVRPGVCRVIKNASQITDDYKAGSENQECTASKVKVSENGKDTKFILAAHCFAHDALGLVLSDTLTAGAMKQVSSKDWKVECPRAKADSLDKTTVDTFRFDGNAMVNPTYINELKKIKATMDQKFKNFVPKDTNKIMTLEERKLYSELKKKNPNSAEFKELEKKFQDLELYMDLKEKLAADPALLGNLKKCLIASYTGKQHFGGQNMCSYQGTTQLAQAISKSDFFTGQLVSFMRIFMNPDLAGGDTAVLSAKYTGKGTQDPTTLEFAKDPRDVRKFITNKGPLPNVICKSHGYGSTRYTDYGGDKIDNAAGPGKSLLIEMSNFHFLTDPEDKNAVAQMKEKNNHMSTSYGKYDGVNELNYGEAQDNPKRRNYAISFALNQTTQEYGKTKLTNWSESFGAKIKNIGAQQGIAERSQIDEVDMSHNSLAPGDSGGPLICQKYEGDCVKNCKQVLGRYSLHTEQTNFMSHPLANSFSNRLFQQCVNHGTMDSVIWQKIVKETIAQAHGGDIMNKNFMGETIQFSKIGLIPDSENITHKPGSKERNVNFLLKPEEGVPSFSGKSCVKSGKPLIVGMNQSILKRNGNTWAILGNSDIQTAIDIMDTCTPKGKELEEQLAKTSFSSAELDRKIRDIVEDCRCQQDVHILKTLTSGNNETRKDKVSINDPIDVKDAASDFSYNWDRVVSYGTDKDELDVKLSEYRPVGFGQKNLGGHSASKYTTAVLEVKKAASRIAYCQTSSSKYRTKFEPYFSKVAFSCSINLMDNTFDCPGAEITKPMARSATGM